MRRNSFGDRYCESIAETRGVLDECGWDVYVPAECFYPPEAGRGATCEVVENGSGDLVCYIELPTEAEVRAAVATLGLEVV